MKKLKTLATVSVTLILSLTLIPTTLAQNPDEMQTFLPAEDLSGDYVGISVKFDATQETIPGENITINLWIKCTAEDVNVTRFDFNIYAFRYGREKVPLDSRCVMENSQMMFNETTTYNCTVYVPTDVWDTTYTEMHLAYTVVDEPVERNPSFPTTLIRNVYLEELENMLESLNYTYWQLNETFWKSFQMNLTRESLTSLNQTYWELKKNYTSVQVSLGELENTRRAVIILAITTVFFIATTIYVIMRRPRQYW